MVGGCWPRCGVALVACWAFGHTDKTARHMSNLTVWPPSPLVKLCMSHQNCQVMTSRYSNRNYVIVQVMRKQPSCVLRNYFCLQHSQSLKIHLLCTEHAHVSPMTDFHSTPATASAPIIPSVYQTWLPLPYAH